MSSNGAQYGVGREQLQIMSAEYSSNTIDFEDVHWEVSKHNKQSTCLETDRRRRDSRGECSGCQAHERYIFARRRKIQGRNTNRKKGADVFAHEYGLCVVHCNVIYSRALCTSVQLAIFKQYEGARNASLSGGRTLPDNRRLARRFFQAQHGSGPRFFPVSS